MMSCIDNTNCQILHEFADRFDCPPLKLTAWRLIQETTPAYAAMPSLVLDGASTLVSPGSGLTGPAESFKQFLNGDFHDDEEELPSIFGPYQDNSSYPDPSVLPSDSTATEIVHAWAARLQDVYNQCNPQYYDPSSGSFQIDWGSELKIIYQLLNLPEKISMIDQILDMFKGKEEQMMESILVKYKDVLPAEYTIRMSEMLRYYLATECVQNEGE